MVLIRPVPLAATPVNCVSYFALWSLVDYVLLERRRICRVDGVVSETMFCMVRWARIVVDMHCHAHTPHLYLNIAVEPVRSCF